MRAVDATSVPTGCPGPPGSHHLRLYCERSDAAPSVQRWTGSLGSSPTEAAIRQLYAAEGVQPPVWGNSPSDTDAVHEHGDVKVLRVVRGGIRFNLPRRTESLELGPGDAHILAADVAHSTVVGPDGVTCLEAHRPTP